MFVKLISCALVGLASLVSASDPTTPQILRSRSNATSLAYNGFYLATYHQGAGFADTTLIVNASLALGGPSSTPLQMSLSINIISTLIRRFPLALDLLL